MTFAERLKELRTERQMSLEDVAQAVGVQRANIYKYEHGLILNVPEDKLNRLAKLFRVSKSYLMGWTDNRTVNADSEDENTDKVYSPKELTVINGLMKCTIGSICEGCTYNGLEECVENLMRDALDVICTKRPVRPKKYPPTRYSDTTYGCRVCGAELSPGKPKYCHECGRSVKWD